MFSRNGVLGSKIGAIENELMSTGIRDEKLKAVFAEFDKDSLSLIDECMKHLSNLFHVLGGILHGEPGDRYDTITNFDSVGGFENSRVISSWEDASNQLSKTYALGIEAKDLEYTKTK